MSQRREQLQVTVCVFELDGVMGEHLIRRAASISGGTSVDPNEHYRERDTRSLSALG
tara:strand:+ start:210 stop:380 length:171 start_codon:yes stop_codon:yes gene_type:complete